MKKIDVYNQVADIKESFSNYMDENFMKIDKDLLTIYNELAQLKLEMIDFVVELDKEVI